VTWTVSNQNLAGLTTDEDNAAILTGITAGQVTLTASAEGVTAQEQVTILSSSSYPVGTAVWSAPPPAGFSVIQLAQAVPSAGGPDLYSISTSSDGTQSIIQALRADGEQLWQTTMPTMLNNAVPDGFGGLIVTTCVSGSPLTVVDLDATGQPVWQVQSAQVRGYGYICYAPQIAVDGSGVAYIAEPTNAGLPSITEAYPNTSIQSFQFPPSIVNNTAIQCCVGPPMVNTDGTMYVEYEVRTTSNNIITSDMLYLYNSANGQSTLLSSTSQDEALLPGPIIPDGLGGVLVTWTISPSHSVLQYPYQAADVTNGVVGTPYNLPFSPQSVAFGQSPTLVLGENGLAFATDGVDAVNGPVVASFNVSSGAVNWSYRAGTQSTLTIVAVISDGSLAVNDSQLGVTQLDTGGNPTQLTGALGGVPQYSWGGNWYVQGSQSASQLLQLSAVDSADPWAAPYGGASRNGSPVALCPCLQQSTASGPSARNEGEPTPQPEGGALGETPPPSPANCFICTLPPPNPPQVITSCLTFVASGPTYLILVGDAGLQGHNLADLPSLAAQQKANDLQGQGDNVIACRVSTIQDFNAALTTNGFIAGDVIYYGHSGLRGFGTPVTQYASLIFVGQGTGDNTNIGAYNIALLCPPPGCKIDTILSSNTAIRINGCQAGETVLGYYTSPHIQTSIAQLISNQLRRGVYAYDVGAYYSHLDAAHDLYFDGKDPITGKIRLVSDNLPMYAIPQGAPGKKPPAIAFTPH